MIWIILAIFACLAEAMRAIVIKKYFKDNTHILVFNTRLIAFFVILLLLPFNDIMIKDGELLKFILALVITVSFTLIATLLKLSVIIREEISKTSPMLALTPLFIIPWSIIILNESPSVFTLIGIIIVVIGAIIVNYNGKSTLESKMKPKSIFLILIILTLYGLTTVVDKIAISHANAYTYTFIWTLSSLLSSSYVLFVYKPKRVFKETLTKFNLLQGLLWALAFLGQQFAVGLSMDIPMNSGYVKSIMYIGIIFSILIGGKVFKEKKLLLKLLGALTIIIGNIIILYFLLK